MSVYVQNLLYHRIISVTLLLFTLSSLDFPRGRTEFISTIKLIESEQTHLGNFSSPGEK